MATPGGAGAVRDQRAMFELEPIGERPVSDIHGIGPTYAKRLSAKGYDKAFVVFGQYLVLKKNKRLFVDWMHYEFGIPKVNAKSAYECLDKWSSSFL